MMVHDVPYLNLAAADSEYRPIHTGGELAFVPN